LHPRYDVAPSQIVETIIERREAPGTDALGLRLAHSDGTEARADQRAGRDLGYLTDVPRRFKRHRCLVVTDGFYEWAEE